jgi:hypothetical protein
VIFIVYCAYTVHTLYLLQAGPVLWTVPTLNVYVLLFVSFCDVYCTYVLFLYEIEELSYPIKQGRSNQFSCCRDMDK